MTSIEISPRILTAVRTERQVSLPVTGIPTVLIFHTLETSLVVRTINLAIREKYRQADEVLVASVSDLHLVPDLLRGASEDIMNQIFDGACVDLPGWVRPEDYVVILPDWDGQLAAATGLSGLDQTAAVVVLDGRGGVVGVYQGANLASAALALLAQAFEAD